MHSDADYHRIPNYLIETTEQEKGKSALFPVVNAFIEFTNGNKELEKAGLIKHVKSLSRTFMSVWSSS